MKKNISNKVGDRPHTEKVSHPSNHNTAYDFERVALPLPPDAGEETRFEMEVYARFMRHLRNVPNSRMEIKILSSIQFTADMMDLCDALVAKTLTDLGLKAPRKAFPLSFLDFVDKSIMRTSWDHSSPSLSIIKLNEHWKKIGEDQFGNKVPGQYSVFNENNYVSA